MSRAQAVHLIGIGGAAMTPLATILLQRGVRVSGSDVCASRATEMLEALGARVFLGHQAEQVGDVDVVVISSAVPSTNPEVQAATSRGIPVVKHSAALGSLMRERRGVAVAGTHGKTTTSALIAFLLDQAGLNPTFHVGSELLNYGLSGRHGSGDILVAEADEFDRRFLDYDPEIAVVTGIESDHLDYFGTFTQLVAAFEEFVLRVLPGGALVLCADNPISYNLAVPNASRTTYGYAENADWRVMDWQPARPTGSRFTLRAPDGELHQFDVGLLGRHNAANAAAAVAVGALLGVTPATAAQALAEFRGTRRRFEVVGTAQGVTVVDDYAHHPTAVRATLAAARAHFQSAIWAVFQPHTAHRTLSLFDSFVECFGDADHVIVTPTYRPPGREDEAEDPSVSALVAAMAHPDARSLAPAQAVETVVGSAQRGDLVLVMGAGDIWTIESAMLAGIERWRRDAP